MSKPKIHMEPADLRVPAGSYSAALDDVSANFQQKDKLVVFGVLSSSVIHYSISTRSIVLATTDYFPPREARPMVFRPDLKRRRHSELNSDRTTNREIGINLVPGHGQSAPFHQRGAVKTSYPPHVVVDINAGILARHRSMVPKQAWKPRFL